MEFTCSPLSMHGFSPHDLFSSHKPKADLLELESPNAMFSFLLLISIPEHWVTANTEYQSNTGVHSLDQLCCGKLTLFLP